MKGHWQKDWLILCLLFGHFWRADGIGKTCVRCLERRP